MVKCSSCGLVIIPEYDEYENKYKDPWTDVEGRKYCDQCFYELYTEPEEKAINNYNHNNKIIREMSRTKIKELEEFWGIKS